MDTKIEIKEMPEVRQDACITLSGDVKTEGEIGKAIIPGGKHVDGRFPFNTIVIADLVAELVEV